MLNKVRILPEHLLCKVHSYTELMSNGPILTLVSGLVISNVLGLGPKVSGLMAVHSIIAPLDSYLTTGNELRTCIGVPAIP